MDPTAPGSTRLRKKVEEKFSGERSWSTGVPVVTSSLPNQTSLYLLEEKFDKLSRGKHTIVVAQGASDEHLSINRCVFLLSVGPDLLPWLFLCFGGWIAVSTDVDEEVLTSDVLHRLFVMRSHLELGQRSRS